MYRILAFIFLGFVIFSIGVISLFAIYFRVPIPQLAFSPSLKSGQVIPTKTTYLYLSPNPLVVSLQSSESATMHVAIDTSGENVTTVQLEIGYNPHMVANIEMEPAGLFSDAVVLIAQNDVRRGRMTFAMSKRGVIGTGDIASIHFTPRTAGTSEILLLPKTNVTAEGMTVSSLKQAEGATVISQ